MLGTELAVAIQDLRAKILENVIHANVCLVVYRQLPGFNLHYLSKAVNTYK